MDNLVGNSVAPGLASRVLDDPELMLMSAEELPTFADTEHDHNWQRAMIEEMKAIEDNDTWELVDLPLGCWPVGLKWVYKIKRDEHALLSPRHASSPGALSSVRELTSRKSSRQWGG